MSTLVSSTNGYEMLRRSVPIERPASIAFAWHERPGALPRLAPPWAKMTLVSAVGGIRDGARVELRQHLGPFRVSWKVNHTDYVENVQFRDVAETSPFRSWDHLHRVEARGSKACLWLDEVRYRLPGGPLGRTLLRQRVRRELDRLFTYRHSVLKADLEQSPLPTPQRVLVAGASGLIGSALVAHLSTQGHNVLRLVRQPSTRPGELSWNPEASQLQDGHLEGVDTVINLSGANIADGRWSDRRKDAISRSRRMATQTLVTAFKRVNARPRLFISASAVGYYGNRGDEVLTEEASQGQGFLAQVCGTWEADARQAEDLGIRTVLLRTGVVLTPAGGALAKLLPLFQAGMGGPVGDGRAWMSWLTPDDYAGAVLHAMATPALQGPCNLASPEPVQSRDFARALGRVLGRPHFLVTPAWALRAAFGQMAEETLLASQRATPERLTATGYRFRHGTIEDALRHLLGRTQVPLSP